MPHAGLLIALTAVTLNPVTPIPLTSNDTADEGPRIADGRVVWQGVDEDGDTEIFLYSDGVVDQITDNAVADEDPDVSASKIVWSQFDGNDFEIVSFEDETPGATPQLLTDNDVIGLLEATHNDRDPVVTDTMVWWTSTTGSILFDGTAALCRHDGVSANCVALASHYFYLTASAAGVAYVAANLTDGSAVATFDDDDIFGDPPVDTGSSYSGVAAAGDVVVWTAPPSSNPMLADQLFYDEGMGPQRVTSDDEASDPEDAEPSISLSPSGMQIVWQRREAGGDWELFRYDGHRIEQLTDNDWDDTRPQVDGELLVWQSNEGGDSEIVMAALPVPEPGAPASGAAALALLVTLPRLARRTPARRSKRLPNR